MWRWCSLLTVFVFSTAYAAPPTPEQVFNEVAHEMIECAAYFGIVSVAMENSNKPDMAEHYKKFGDDALLKALFATKKAGMKDETVSARYQMALNEMSDRIGMNTSNISILMAKYNDVCIEAMTDVNKRLQFWLRNSVAPSHSPAEFLANQHISVGAVASTRHCIHKTLFLGHDFIDGVRGVNCSAHCVIPEEFRHAQTFLLFRATGAAPATTSRFHIC